MVKLKSKGNPYRKRISANSANKKFEQGLKKTQMKSKKRKEAAEKEKRFKQQLTLSQSKAKDFNRRKDLYQVGEIALTRRQVLEGRKRFIQEKYGKGRIKNIDSKLGL